VRSEEIGKWNKRERDCTLGCATQMKAAPYLNKGVMY